MRHFWFIVLLTVRNKTGKSSLNSGTHKEKFEDKVSPRFLRQTFIQNLNFTRERSYRNIKKTQHTSS